jgi:AsmA protein
MKRFFRYGVVPVGIFLLLLLATAVLIPILINVQRFVPEIEKQVRIATGRPFSLGPDLGLTLFPWLSISFSEMELGNPPGFSSQDFVRIGTFEARIKVLPLLRKKIEISRFVMGDLSINLEKSPSGLGNWERVRKNGTDDTGDTPAPWGLNLFSENLSIALLAVTDGRVQWHDHSRNRQYRVDDIMLLVNDFSHDAQVSLDCKASFNGKPLFVEGHVGPLADHKEQVSLPVDLSLEMVKTLRGRMRGAVTQLNGVTNADLVFKVNPFSLHELYAALDRPFPLATDDSETFKAIELEVAASGGRNELRLDKGVVRLDDSTLNFSLLAKNFRQPEIQFDFDLDRIDLDRYLPAEKDTVSKAAVAPGERRGGKDIQHGEFSLTGLLRVGELKVRGGTLTAVSLPVHGRDGVITVAPVSLSAYGGKLEADLTLDLKASPPALQVSVQAKELDSETLIQAFGGGNILRGTLFADAALHSVGDSRAAIWNNLAGEATLLVRQGALLGLDLSGMDSVRPSAASTDTVAEPDEMPKTEFTEAKGMVSISNGILRFQDTALAAPSLGLQLHGSVDMVGEQLDVQMESETVVTVVGKGGREEKVERTSFYSLTGSFSEPELKSGNNQSGEPGIDSRMQIKQLISQKLPPLVDEEGKKMVGRDLVDPSVVAQRFGLQPEVLRPSQMKKKLPVGKGTVSIGPLHEEPELY